MTEDRMCNISTTIPRDLYDYVDDARWRERRSVASIVREAIHQWAVAHGWENPAIMVAQEPDSQ